MPSTRRRKQPLKPVDTNTDPTTSNSKSKVKRPNAKSASQKRRSEPARTSKRLSVKLEKVKIETPERRQDEGESDDDDSSDEDTQGASSGISDYEQMRLKNMEENAKFFASLGIFQAKDDFVAATKTKKKVSLGLKSERRKSAPLPRRAPSLRLQGKTPDGSEIPGFDGFKPAFFSSGIKEEREQERHPAGPLKMECMNVKKETKEEGADFISSLAEMTSAAAKLGAEGSSLLKRLKSLKLIEGRVAKVVPNRSFSIGFHPLETKTIIAVGDKWGQLGFWHVDSSQGDDGVFLFSPHVRPINCLRFCPSQSTKIFTSSYDGTVRCGDFEKGVFDEIYATEEEDYNSMIHCFDFLDTNGTNLLLAQNEGGGHIAIVDTRGKTSPQIHRLHEKNIRTVSVHPCKPHYFVTASIDCDVALWDIRNLKKSHSSICSLAHGRGVNAAYFSPVTGSKILTTCADDKLRVYRLDETDSIVKSATLATSKYHNNHTGRWLTKFRAIWHPRCEELIMVGSMARPRRIELFSDKLELVHEYLSEEWLGSVCSLNAFHPTKDIVAGTNSSGRVHVFM